MMADYDWLLVGAGIHGQFIARCLKRAAPAARVALIDPHEPLADWRRRCQNCGMQYLRSTSVHHLGLAANSLRLYARQHGYDETHMLGRYQRPSLALFNAHAHEQPRPAPQIYQQARHIAAEANGDWRLELADGQALTSRRVVLATGPGRTRRPAGLETAAHVLDTDFELGPPGAATLIIGGGISGAQLALRASQAGHRICWLTRYAPQQADFDSHGCYAGPRCLEPFWQTPLAQRSALLDQARRPGTLPPDIHRHITMALAKGQLVWQKGTPHQLVPQGLQLADGRIVQAERVILATGFETHIQPESLLHQAMKQTGALEDGRGHLQLENDLSIAPGLHITGRPASLQLGPMAGNIKGARLAGQILADMAQQAG